MSKSLSARIAELETTSSRANNRAAFLAVRDEVKQAIDDGWPVKAIWRTLCRDQRIAVGYEGFRKYVIRLIEGHGLESGRKTKRRGFDFDPVADVEKLF